MNKPQALKFSQLSKYNYILKDDNYNYWALNKEWKVNIINQNERLGK